MRNFLKTGTLLLFILLFTGACSDDDNNSNGGIDINQLPATARQFISYHFGQTDSYTLFKANSDEDEYTYKAVLADKTNIYFSESGEWLKVDGNERPLPKTLRNLYPQTEIFLLENYSTWDLSVIEKTVYGYRYDMQWRASTTNLAFEHDGKYIGVDLSNKIEYTLNENSKTFLSKHFDKAKKMTLIRFAVGKSLYYKAFAAKPYECAVVFNYSNGEWMAIDCYNEQSVLPESIFNDGLPTKTLQNIKDKYPNGTFLSVKKEKNGIDILVKKDQTTTVPLFYISENNIIEYPIEIKNFIDTYFDNEVGFNMTFYYFDAIQSYGITINNFWTIFDQNSKCTAIASNSQSDSLPQDYIDNELPKSIRDEIEYNYYNSTIWKVERDNDMNYLVSIYRYEINYTLKFDSNGYRISD